MNLNELTAISPIDGRYRKQVNNLAPYFSEFGLIKYRVKIEIEYLIALVELPLPQLKDFPNKTFPQLRAIYENLTESDAIHIKDLEKKANHDVKAVEYFIKEQLSKLGLDSYLEFVHFALTSQDINNTAIPLLLKDAIDKELIPLVVKVQNVLLKAAKEWNNISMLAKRMVSLLRPPNLAKR